MIDSNPRIKTRTQSFYGRYTYCGQFYLPEAGALRQLDHDRIDSIIEVRRNWNRRINFGGSWKYGGGIDITDKIVLDLHGICDFLLGSEVDRKVVIYSHHLYVYTNDLDFIRRMARTGIGSLIEVTQASLSGTPGTVVLKKPQYQYRSYFRELRLESATAHAYQQFLKNQEDIRLSPSIKYAIETAYRVCLPYYFLDHNDQGVITMLGMIEPRLIRKTVPITAAK